MSARAVDFAGPGRARLEALIWGVGWRPKRLPVTVSRPLSKAVVKLDRP